jgi:hypothetical protein
VFTELVPGRGPAYPVCSADSPSPLPPEPKGFVFLLAIVFLFTGFSSFLRILSSCFSMNLRHSVSDSRTASIFHSFGLAPFFTLRFYMLKQHYSYIVKISSLMSKSPSFSLGGCRKKSSKLSCFTKRCSCWGCIGLFSPSGSSVAASIILAFFSFYNYYYFCILASRLASSASLASFSWICFGDCLT